MSGIVNFEISFFSVRIDKNSYKSHGMRRIKFNSFKCDLDVLEDVLTITSY